MVTKKMTQIVAIAMICSSCSQKDSIKTITVTNTLDFERTFETVELSKELLKVDDLSTIGIRDSNTKKLQLTQTVDNDGDGSFDVILFQPQIAANSGIQYDIVTIKESDRPKADTLCYSRFVPERTDDYTWENDKVAFRVYGPTAQKMVEEGDPKGTLSSGVDAWLKKVDYPIINKWYKKTTEGTGTYHEDTGEGLDDFHVGRSRGVGGIAAKIDTTYYYSKNYTKWRTITTGPLRTSFYLEYEDWNADGKLIKENMIISLDLGSHLSKFKIVLEGIDGISAGLTLHEKDGDVTGNTENGWVSYWQPHGDSELGTALVSTKKYFMGFETYETNAKDLSNAYLNLKIHNKIVEYYAGFGWKKRGQFESKAIWEQYLSDFSKKMNNPLKVVIK